MKSISLRQFCSNTIDTIIQIITDETISKSVYFVRATVYNKMKVRSRRMRRAASQRTAPQHPQRNASGVNVS